MIRYFTKALIGNRQFTYFVFLRRVSFYHNWVPVYHSWYCRYRRNQSGWSVILLFLLGGISAIVGDATVLGVISIFCDGSGEL